VLLDRGFYNVEVAKAIDKIGIEFIIFSKMYQSIRDILDIVGEQNIIMQRVIRIKYAGCVEVNFVCYYDNNRKIKLCYITNMDTKPEETYALYRKRWGIETGYRVKGNFTANTCSKSLSIRIAYSMFSILLYNIWVLINLILDQDIIENVIKKFGWRATSKQYKPHITVEMLKHALSRINMCGCVTF